MRGGGLRAFEFLLGTVLLTCVLASSVELFVFAVRSQSHSDEQTVARRLAYEAVAHVRNLPPEELRSLLHGKGVSEEGGYSVRFTVNPARSAGVGGKEPCVAVTVQICRDERQLLRFHLLRSPVLE